VWTEYIPTPKQAEYMAVPRMTALAEVLWTPAALRDWDDFRKRINTQFKRFDAMGINYSKGSWRVEIQPEMSADGRQFAIALETEQPGFPVYYTLDGIEPDTTSALYSGPFLLKESATVKAGIFKHGKLQEQLAEKSFLFHKALGKPATLTSPPNKRYKGKGALTLVDGMTGSTKYNDGYWLGFKGDDLELLIDLEENMPVKLVKIYFYQRQASWIFLPVKVTIELLDEQQQTLASKTMLPQAKADAEGVIIENFKAEFAEAQGQFIRIHGFNRGLCPAWHRGAGQPCWIFADEVIVD
jgi:hexosaminidase